MHKSRPGRLELKYYIRPSEIDVIRAMIAPFMVPDRFSAGSEDHTYVVRSIYFDTRTLRFYREKEAGEKTRKKLRLRVYNDDPVGATSFLETKRKFGSSIVKERVQIPFERAVSMLEDHALEGRHEGLSETGAARVERFLFLCGSLCLQPSVLVVYDREAYVAREDARIRVTFDYRLRCLARPRLREIFSQSDLRSVTGENQILEVKFDGVMPAWLRPVTRRLDRSFRPISKYCESIDTWSASYSAAQVY